MAKSRTTRNQEMQDAVRKMQLCHAPIAKYGALQDQLVTAIDQENLAMIKSLLEEKIPRAESNVADVMGPASAAMRTALHARWPVEFKADVVYVPTVTVVDPDSQAGVETRLHREAEDLHGEIDDLRAQLESFKEGLKVAGDALDKAAIERDKALARLAVFEAFETGDESDDGDESDEADDETSDDAKKDGE